MEKILRDPRLYQFFEKVDVDRAQSVRAAGCEYCGGSLHQADYDRKPRGGPAEVMDRWDKRHSFCCEKGGCRKRHTPPSVRFLGRKVWTAIPEISLSVRWSMRSDIRRFLITLPASLVFIKTNTKPQTLKTQEKTLFQMHHNECESVMALIIMGTLAP